MHKTELIEDITVENVTEKIQRAVLVFKKGLKESLL